MWVDAYRKLMENDDDWVSWPAHRSIVGRAADRPTTLLRLLSNAIELNCAASTCQELPEFLNRNCYLQEVHSFAAQSEGWSEWHNTNNNEDAADDNKTNH